MSSLELSRRAALVSFAALLGGPALAARKALARIAPLAGVRVDVAPLLANSGEPTAGWVAQTLPPAIATALATTGRGGEGVGVTIEYVILGPNSGGVGPTGASPDQMIGTVTVGGVSRPLRATTYYYPSSVDNTMIAQSNYDRIYQLSQAFAYWVARGY